MLGGEAEAIAARVGGRLAAGLGPGGALRHWRGALAGPDRVLAAADLEVAVLAVGNGRRAFRRLDDDELDALLA